MGFSISTRELRTIPDYAVAAEKYANTKPIRGLAEDIRPLGKRRAHHMRIMKDGDVYHAVLYRSRCVSYYPDGVIALSSDGYSSVSTSSFIHAVSPVSAFTSQQMWIHTPAGNYALPRDNRPLKIKRDEAGQWAVLNPEQLSKKSYNRVTTKKLRTHLKPLLDWMKITFALIANEDGVVDLGQARKWNELEGYMRDPRIPEDPSHFFACVIVEMRTSRGHPWTASRIRSVLLKKTYQQAVRLGLCTEEELYTLTPVPLGECFRQRSL